MHGPPALVLTPTELLSAPIIIISWLAVSLAAANAILPAPSTPSERPGNARAPQLPEANSSLSLLAHNITADYRFHIPDSPIDLTITNFGNPILYRALQETVELALDEIASNVDLQPAEPITNGRFSQRHNGLEIRVQQYVGKQIIWWLLHQLLSGIQYFASLPRRSREMRFEIDVENKGRVGYGSVWQVGLLVPGGSSIDVAKRARNDDNNSTHLGITRPSSTPPASSMHSTLSLLSPVLKDSHIIFAYYFFGPTIPESAVSMCFGLARRSIRDNVQRHPLDLIPYGSFSYHIEWTPVSVGVEAFPHKEITWLLLDHILRDVSEDLIRKHHLWECKFEFEIAPFVEALGRGYLMYVTAVGDDSSQARAGDQVV